MAVSEEHSNEATFKQLIVEGKRKYLKALNPDWPERIIQSHASATICGVVIFKGEEPARVPLSDDRCPGNTAAPLARR